MTSLPVLGALLLLLAFTDFASAGYGRHGPHGSPGHHGPRGHHGHHGPLLTTFPQQQEILIIEVPHDNENNNNNNNEMTDGSGEGLEVEASGLESSGMESELAVSEPMDMEASGETVVQIVKGPVVETTIEDGRLTQTITAGSIEQTIGDEEELVQGPNVIQIVHPAEGSGIESVSEGSGEASGEESSGTMEVVSRVRRHIRSEASGEEPEETESSGIEASGEVEVSDKKCETLAICQSDEDCLGGKCMGSALGTCDCNACINFWKCNDDSDCGGLQNACNNGTSMCDCFAAHQTNGFKDLLSANLEFCNVRKCDKKTSTDDCFGLPCNSGRCFC